MRGASPRTHGRLPACRQRPPWLQCSTPGLYIPSHHADELLPQPWRRCLHLHCPSTRGASCTIPVRQPHTVCSRLTAAECQCWFRAATCTRCVSASGSSRALFRLRCARVLLTGTCQPSAVPSQRRVVCQERQVTGAPAGATACIDRRCPTHLRQLRRLFRPSRPGQACKLVCTNPCAWAAPRPLRHADR